MFSNFAWSEMLIIACVAIIVVGPKDLPGMLRQLGKTIGNVKRMAGDFQRQFNDAIQEAELDELKDMTSAKGFSPLEDAKKSMEDFTKSVNESVMAKEAEEAVQPPAKKVAAKTTAKKPAAKRTATKKTTSSASAKTAAKKPAVTAAKKPAAKRTAPKKAATTTAKRRSSATTKSAT